MDVSKEQIRRFRLQTHHLDTWYSPAEALDIAGVIGLQNSPPGSWEKAMLNRISGISHEELKQMLEVDKSLLQAWSFRGAPVVFPARDSSVFLSALIPQGSEPWIYTHGIQLALDYLQMPFEKLLMTLKQLMPKLDEITIKSKTTLDQTLAEWMEPLLPKEKRDSWNSPSMYGNPDKQTVGGAVASFLLRPCSFMGLIVFGKREGTSPTFTSYQNWMGEPLKPEDCPEQKLVRKFIHCYGPTSSSEFAKWLGCSPEQAKRMWASIVEEIDEVSVSGKSRFILSSDRDALAAAPIPERKVHLLSGHDPYLGLQDRATILEDKDKQRVIWQTVSNPGAILYQGEIVGTWKSRKRGRNQDIEIDTWKTYPGLDQSIKELTLEK